MDYWSRTLWYEPNALATFRKHPSSTKLYNVTATTHACYFLEKRDRISLHNFNKLTFQILKFSHYSSFIITLFIKSCHVCGKQNHFAAVCKPKNHNQRNDEPSNGQLIRTLHTISISWPSKYIFCNVLFRGIYRLE